MISKFRILLNFESVGTAIFANSPFDNKKISKFNNKAVISGINMMKKHTKPNPQLGETGGIVEKEAAINLSNIAIWNPKQKKADRISFQTDGEKKLRVYTSDKKEIKS